MTRQYVPIIDLAPCFAGTPEGKNSRSPPYTPRSERRKLMDMIANWLGNTPDFAVPFALAALGLILTDRAGVLALGAAVLRADDAQRRDAGGDGNQPGALGIPFIREERR
ncbi:hypothetical protein Psest_0765 [Stutzerimonas stutzeri RCH2]|uniref:Uncharacterized protein n=1 Tax=Stutzerimonas stutzeri RCH2 TaxID=644801 RepID=L0GF32_STUST|nr:hypothetical protein Psest_0765 [Stutzerimonas stutzeri RCH2]